MQQQCYYSETNLSLKQQSSILVIDDNTDYLQLIGYAFDLFDYQYITAATAKEGLLYAREKQPSLILLDIVLPEISGLEVMELLQESSLTASIPVIAVTVMTAIQNRHFFLSLGFVDCLAKPYPLQELKLLIEYFL